MGFSSVKKLVDAYEAGQTQLSSFRRVSGNAVAAISWIDLSMHSGNPVANFYANSPLESATLTAKNGIYHGEDVALPATKHLKTMNFTFAASVNSVNVPHLLLDYLLYYPFIDMDSTDEQVFTTNVTLPRYQDGKGVRAFLVSLGAYTGGQAFTISYTNEKGESGRTSQRTLTNFAAVPGCILSGGTNVNLSPAPFIGLQLGDQGMRSVESITFEASNGGIAALVLARPLAINSLREITACAEKDFLLEGSTLPRIYNGAYLNFITYALGSVAAAPYHGYIETIWGTD